MERLSMGHLEPQPPSWETTLTPLAQIPEIKWLVNIILERALTRGDYILSGGIRSDFYIDKFRLFSDPSVLRRITRLFTPIVTQLQPDLIAGTELGGVILATTLSQMTGIPMIIVRKSPKGYGAFADEYVEGGFMPGQRVLLLEDIVTSGREVLASKARLEELNLHVDICAVINRGLAPIKALVQFSLPRGDAKTEN
ncbi:MAG TPA: phosphoribosyltransferase family protein [Candidatus Acidoferrales bacterium]|nr:phosphoribosyltransferase family protein [Candidatus Acidoferrales bacterium]